MNSQIAAKQTSPEVVCKDSYIYSERQGAVYNGSETVDIYIPQSYALINTKNTYLAFRLNMKGVLKKMVSMRAGVASLIRDLTIYNGQGDKVLEQLDNYAIAQALYNFYNNNETINNLRVLHEGQPFDHVINNTVGNQYCKADEVLPDKMNTEVEVLLPLYMSGILSPDRANVFAALATGGLRIKINLNSARQALQCMTAPLYDTSGAELETMYNTKYNDKGGGGYTQTSGYEIMSNAATSEDPTTIVLKSKSDTLATTNGVLSENVVKPAHLFAVGQTVQLNGVETQEITAITMSNVAIGGVTAYRINLTFAKLDTALNAGERVHIVTSNMENEEFEFKDVKLNLSYVVPPPGYIEEIQKQINSGLKMSIKTYTDYAVNISKDSLTNSLYINARNNNAKSIICVGQHSDNSDIIQDSFIPDRDTPRQYQWSIYKVLTPNKTVSLERSNLESFDAEHLRELQHGISAADIPVNNIYKAYKHFAIARRLAQPTYTYNMNKPDEGEVRLMLDYSKVNPTLMHNFVFHVREFTIMNNGIEILY